MMPSQTGDSILNMRFPAISITQIGVITTHADRTSLEVGRVKMLRRGWYDGMLIVDSEGRAFRVTYATHLGGYGPLLGFSLTYSRRIRLGLELKAEGTLDLADMKDAICKAMQRDPHMWEADISENGVLGWQAKVQQATNITEIIKLLTV